MQLDDDQIEELREPAYKAQTFRFTTIEVEWLRDAAYQLSKSQKRGKVTQADIVRLALRLFQNALASDKRSLQRVLERIK